MHLLSPRALRTLLPLLPAIATLLMLGMVLWANEGIVARDLTQRAHYRVAQSAGNFADQLGRTLARRSDELQTTGRLITTEPFPNDAQVREELQRLHAKSTAYEWLGLLNEHGQLSAATSPLAQMPSADLGAALAPDTNRPSLIEVSALWGNALPLARSTPPLGAIVVPLRNAQGQSRGSLVALMNLEYFENMRQFAMGEVPGRRALELQLATAQGHSLLGSDTRDNLLAWPVLRALPVGKTRSATDNDGGQWLYAQSPLKPVDSPLQSPWTVVARQPLDAATGPADRLQIQLLLWGLPAALIIGGLGMWMSRRIAQPYQEVLNIVAAQADSPQAKAPGAYLSAAADALRRLAPMWRGGDGSQALLDQVVQDAQRLQQVLEQLPTPVYLLDAHDRVSLWNLQAEAVFGWSKAQALGRPIAELVPGEVHAGAPTPTPGQTRNFEARTANRRGEPLFGEWRLLPLSDESGEIQGQIVLMRDIGDRVRAAATLARHEADLSEFTQRLMEQEQVTTRRLAQTLHDQLGQTLGAIRLSFDALHNVWNNAETPRHRQRAQTLDGLIGQAIAQVRQALVDLRPPLLEEQGLAAALDNEIGMRQIEAEPVELCFEHTPTVEQTPWPPDVAYAAFMVAREAVGNALRHARGSKVVVRLEGDAHAFVLRIEDNGIGLANTSPGAFPGHLGLVGMRERALAIEARLDIGPAQPHGLVVQLTWPATNTLLTADWSSKPAPHPDTPTGSPT
jgi:PAS domain S-box-containing protein